MNYIYKLEQRFGRYAISNLTLYLILGYVVGYVLSVVPGGSTFLMYLTLDPCQILHGQVWRLVTWVLIPPSTQNIFFYVIMMMFYYQLGMALERTWGTFRYNIYIFGGMFYTVVGSFVTWLVLILRNGNHPALGQYVGWSVSTYYICMSIFLAFAACYPDNQVMLYFVIPVKMKWLAYVYAALMLVDFVGSDGPGRVMLFMSLLNFLIFFFSTRDYKKFNPKEAHRKKVYRQAVTPKRASGTVTKHKCAICGRTELDDPTLEFRFCSKCNGNYEYCQEHLFTHKHRT